MHKVWACILYRMSDPSGLPHAHATSCMHAPVDNPPPAAARMGKQARPASAACMQAPHMLHVHALALA
eukprot:357886-Chlamydomonas_euryale.AAC.11